MKPSTDLHVGAYGARRPQAGGGRPLGFTGLSDVNRTAFEVDRAVHIDSAGRSQFRMAHSDTTNHHETARKKQGFLCTTP